MSRRALLVWGAGLLAYIAAVFHRTSLGVAGVDAAHRFGVSASLLATLSVAQLAVYAVMQVPVGLLLDRYGPRRLLAAGALLMAAGQLAFALVPDVGSAVAARMLIGVGDAMTFISLVRVVATWFPPRRNPVVVQLTGVLGMLGSLASAVPLVVLLRDAGWTVTFLAAAGLGLAVSGLVLLVLRDAPAGSPAREPLSTAQVRDNLRASWSQPATGIVKVGGFCASIALTTGVVVVLDVLTPSGSGTHYPLSAFRWAFLLHYALWTVGAVQVVRYRTATRRQLARGVGRDLVAATA